jgi:hypothetical protein
MKAEERQGIRELRFLLHSQRWTVRLFRHVAGASLCSPFVFALLALVLGGPRFLADFPLPWRIAIIASPLLLATLLLWRGQPLLRRLLLTVFAGLLLLSACAWRFGESDEILGELTIFNSPVDLIPLIAFVESPLGRLPTGPPPPPDKIIALVRNGACIPWAATHADAAVYKTAVFRALDGHKPFIALAQYLRWTIPASTQRAVISEARVMYPSALFYQFSPLCHLSAIAPELQEQFLILQSWDLQWSPFSAPAVFDSIQTYLRPMLWDLEIPESTLLPGSADVTPAEFDRLFDELPCYYEFLLQRHPAARRNPKLVSRLLEIQDLSILEFMPLAAGLSVEQRELAFDDPKLALDFAADTGRYDFILPTVRKDPARYSREGISRLAAFIELGEYKALAVAAIEQRASPVPWCKNSMNIPRFQVDILSGLVPGSVSPRYASDVASTAIVSDDAMVAVCHLFGITAGVDLLQERIPRSAAYDALVDAPAELALTLAAAIIMHTPRHHREIVGCAPAPSHPLDRLLCATVKREAIYLTLLFLASCVALAFTPGKSTQPWPLQSPG